jgi:hypothetical protein
MLRAQRQLNAKKNSQKPPTRAQVVAERLGALRVAFQRHIADDAAQLRRVAERLVAAHERCKLECLGDDEGCKAKLTR